MINKAAAVDRCFQFLEFEEESNIFIYTYITYIYSQQSTSYNHWRLGAYCAHTGFGHDGRSTFVCVCICELERSKWSKKILRWFRICSCNIGRKIKVIRTCELAREKCVRIPWNWIRSIRTHYSHTPLNDWLPGKTSYDMLLVEYVNIWNLETNNNFQALQFWWQCKSEDNANIFHAHSSLGVSCQQN